MFDEEYRELLASVDLKPLDYKQVADDWESRQEEWYHAMISEEDLSIILGIPNLKIYAWCRWGPPRGKRDGVIGHISRRENVNWM